jgi:hypothetical protein
VGTAYLQLWEPASALKPLDRVYACASTSVVPGPYTNCPERLPNQNDNWMDAAAIAWGDGFRVTYRWDAVTANVDGTPLDGPVAYVLSWHVPNGIPVEIQTSAPPVVVELPRQRVCAVVRARVGGNLSEPSKEVCVEPAAVIPGQPQNVTVEFGTS